MMVAIWVKLFDQRTATFILCFMFFLPAPSVYEWNRECRVWLNCFL